jgi:hypothetical protein
MKIGLGIGLGYSKESGGAVPPAIASVTISGTAVVGQTLTATASGVTGIPAPTLSYQWKRGVTNIGTNSSTYTLVQADAGNASNITCVVTATNSAGSANATSNTIAQILTARTSAFLTASAISDATIRGGLNTFDIGLIANSLDTKMKAIYPFVADGVDNNARALQQRWNFMDARDLNAAFRLSFSGTLVHSSTGINTNGTNGFYDTNFNCASNGSLNNQSAGVYIRTDLNGIGSSLDFGTEVTLGALLQIYTKFESGGVQYYLGRVNDNNAQFVTNTNSQGFYSISRSSNTTYLRQKNNSVSTITQSSISLPTGNILGFKNLTTYTARQQAFAFIGDGLTNTEMTNYYTLIQALQTTLGRSVGPQVVSDPDAQAFVTAADIQDQVQADAVNTLVIGMKAQGLWTKMKAIYPFVSDKATSNDRALQHRWNLKDPRDLDAAFRLAFSGDITHSANGMQGNGINGYADSFFIPNNNGLTVNNNHLSLYSRTSEASPIGTQFYEMGSGSLDGNSSLTSIFTRRFTNLAGYDSGFFVNNRTSYTSSDGSGFYVGKVNSDLTSKFFRNGVQVATRAITNQASLSAFKTFILGFNENNSTIYYSPKQFAFASMGTGLTDAEASNYYTLVQAYQTTLGRQINP